MPERKPLRTEPKETVDVRATDIFVAKNRTIEPFIRSFVSRPENIFQEPLGMLVGVFSVADRSESSGYIVNALASIAKKEYYANPKRSPEESLEAALHQMNRSLAELVKEGQVDWMGSLSAAIAAIENGHIHFSVTGESAVFLSRGDGFSDISQGLASEEASHHPIKTFIETSSGDLAPGDCVLLVSPELFELFSENELERSARRLVPEKKFLRFLETAMVNELRAGAVVVLEAEKVVRETTPERTPRRTGHRKADINVFSAQAFAEAQAERSETFVETAQEEIIPDRAPETKRPETRNIYIQGDAPVISDEHPMITKLRWMAEDLTLSARRKNGQLWGETRRRTSVFLDTVSERIVATGSTIKNSLHFPTRPNLVFRKPNIRKPDLQLPSLPSIRIPRLNIRTKNLNRVTERILKIAQDISLQAFSFFIRIAATAWKRFLSLPPKRQLLIATGSAFLLSGIGIWASGMFKPEVEDSFPEVVEIQAPKTVFPPEGESRASLGTIETIREHANGNRSIPVFLKEKLYVIEGKSVIETGSGASSEIPSASDVRLAAGMNDLGLILLVTEDNDLFAYAPANRSFTKNNIPTPDGFRADSIGTFLTYLYLLDRTSGNIYRFPRADGGFGQGTLWNKEPLGNNAHSISVSENIYVSDGVSVSAFFRGKKSSGFTLESPKTPLSISALCAHENAPDRFVVLDANEKRAILYSKDGNILSQRFHESITGGNVCSLSRDGTSVAISTDKETFTMRMTE